MSIRGLYDSEVGDKMARKTLTPFYKHEQSKGTHPRRLCACGSAIMFPYVSRGGVKVCKQCAEKTPRVPYKHAVRHKCSKCKNKLPRLNLVIRKGKLYCKSCAKDF